MPSPPPPHDPDWAATHDHSSTVIVGSVASTDRHSRLDGEYPLRR
jgi:hypothetical protein